MTHHHHFTHGLHVLKQLSRQSHTSAQPEQAHGHQLACAAVHSQILGLLLYSEAILSYKN